MRYRLFGRGTGLRVSELALGGALFGTAWGYGIEPGEARRILEAYADAGGNFIDTSDSYQFGQSETIVGDFLVDRRDEFIVASKYTLGAEPGARVLRTGNNRKNMVRSTEASLKRLKTDRIDSSDQLARLDAASAVPLGFPLDFLAAAMQNVRLAGGHPEKIDKPTSPAELRLDAGFDQ